MSPTNPSIRFHLAKIRFHAIIEGTDARHKWMKRENVVLTNRKSLWLIGGLVLLALLVVVFSSLPAGSGTAVVVVTVDGVEFARVPLGQSRTLTIHQQNGAENVLQIDGDGFCMQCASCPDQLCVQQGRVTAQNASSRALGASVVCLPNRVVCTLISDGADTAPSPDL